ncbi:MAG: TlyA family RNA methyltransferase [Lachnospiraceae bacterium]|nr:TlyA family RNA methyltransferase [Lachnospiraceae bacterium]
MTDRLDIILVNRGFAKSREKAKELIKNGSVYINNIMQTKPANIVDEEADIEIRGEVCQFVSRGGYKLEKAINQFKVNLDRKICLDIGASTGGFTDCMLQNGAKLVYAVDVGHDQLDELLCNDERVISLEGVNFRYLESEEFYNNLEIVAGVSELARFASCDVSFISLRHIVPVAFDILADDGEMVCLIKPQFEAGKEHLNKKGVVKEKKIHIKVIREIIEFAENTGFFVKGLSYSPIKGPEGNIEYLLYLTKEKLEQGVFVNAANTVSEAFNE